MTREEAIIMLERLKDRINFEVTDSQKKMDALNMAIEALEQQPCEDATSRQAAIDAMCSVCGHDCDKSKFVYNAPQDEQVILCPEHYALSTPLPSVNPVGKVSSSEKPNKWIPVTKSLPEAEYGESDSVLVCFENETQDVLYFDGSNWRYPTGETYVSVNHKNGWHNKVVAWMPLPEPYEPKESEE